MVSKKMMIINTGGLHLRPAGELCNNALEFEARVILKTKRAAVNAKSILGVLGAGVKYGDEIELICEGSDEEKALERLSKLIEDGFGE